MKARIQLGQCQLRENMRRTEQRCTDYLRDQSRGQAGYETQPFVEMKLDIAFTSGIISCLHVCFKHPQRNNSIFSNESNHKRVLTFEVIYPL